MLSTLGKSFEGDVREVSREKFVETLSSSEMSELALTIATVYQDYAIAGNNGEDESDPREFEEILNRPLTPLTDAIRYVVDEKLFL